MFLKLLTINRSFSKLWVAQIFCQFAINILDFALAIIIYTQTRSNFAVALLVITYGVPAFLFGAFAGVVVDRLNRKNVMVFVNFLRFLLVLMFLVLPKGLLFVLPFAFLMSTLSQFFFPAEGATIPELVKRKDLMEANSLYTLTYYLSKVGGYIIAGPLLKFFPHGITFIVVSVMFFLSFISVLSISSTGVSFGKAEHLGLPGWYRYFAFSHSNSGVSDFKGTFFDIINGFKNKVHPNSSAVKAVFGDLRYALLFVRKNRIVKNALIFLGLSQVMVGVFMTLIPGLGVEVLGVRAEDTSLYLVGPSALGMVVGPVVLSKLASRVKNDILVNVGVFGGGLCFIVLSMLQRIPIGEFATNLPERLNKFLGIDLLFFAVLVMLFVGMFNSFVTVVNNTTLQGNTTSRMRGRLYGLLQTVATSSALFPVLFGGALADVFGVSKVFGGIGVVIIIIGLYLNRFN